MKTNKKTTKVTKKTTKPLYTIKFATDNTGEDIALDFAYSKYEVGHALRPEEVRDILINELDCALEDIMFGILDELQVIDEPCKKSTPWYKRLWNKVTRKK